MTQKVTVRFGGASGSEVHDYSDRISLLDAAGTPAIKGGMQADDGSPGMGELILDDIDNDIPHRTDPPGLQIAAHNQLIWSEDSPGYDAWLSIGRVDNKNVGRPYTYTAGVNRQWTVQWADANIDLDGLTLTADEVRPAETAANRVLYFLGAFCNGSPRLTTVFQTHLVNTVDSELMPAKTYEVGTELVEVFDDCATVDGRKYAVVIHANEAGDEDHTCFQYCDEEDYDNYPCTLSISDQLSEVDGETVFEPHWRQGGATLEQGQELITGLVSRYGADSASTVVVTDSTHADLYDYWAKPYNDDLAATATEATNRATALLHSRWTEHVSHQPSILIPARLHNLIRAGMSITIRSAAAMGGQYLGTEQTRRIAAIEWSHAGWTDEPLLWANLQLDRTPRKLPLSQGTKPTVQPPSAGAAASCSLGDDQMTAISTPNGDVESGSTYWSGGGFLSTYVMASVAHGGTHSYRGDFGGGYLMYSGGWTGYTFKAGVPYALRVWLNFTGGGAVNTIEFGTTGDHMVESGIESVPDGVSVYWEYCGVWTPSADRAGADVYFKISDGSSANLNVDDLRVYVGSAADTPISLGGPGEGDIGSGTPVTIPIGTVVEHGDLSGKGGTMHDASQIEFTPTGTIAATDVQTAIAEVATDAAADLTAHTGDTTDAHDASAISIADAGSYFTGTDVEAALQELGAGGGGGGSALTVEEVDGSPTDSAVTKIKFPNGTLGITSHEATYTPPGPMINTDADPGTKIYVGATDPDGTYTLNEGDVWIDRGP